MSDVSSETKELDKTMPGNNIHENSQINSNETKMNNNSRITEGVKTDNDLGSQKGANFASFEDNSVGDFHENSPSDFSKGFPIHKESDTIKTSMSLSREVKSDVGSKEVSKEEDNNYRDFSKEFESDQTVSLESNNEHSSNDDFGNFSKGFGTTSNRESENIQAKPDVASLREQNDFHPEDNDNFGDFSSGLHERTKSDDNITEPSESSVKQNKTESPTSVQDNDGFRDFSKKLDNKPDIIASINDNIETNAATSENNFGDFADFSQNSFGAFRETSGTTENSGDNFGDFSQSHGDSTQNSGDQFGTFSQKSSTIKNSNDDDFGDFSQSSGSTTQNSDSVGAFSSTDKNAEFGTFTDSSNSPRTQQGDFGDFSSTKSTQDYGVFSKITTNTPKLKTDFVSKKQDSVKQSNFFGLKQTTQSSLGKNKMGNEKSKHALKSLQGCFPKSFSTLQYQTEVLKNAHLNKGGR